MNYHVWVEDGKREVVRKVLLVIADGGLKPPHQCYITFRTHQAGVCIPEFLSAQYPDEMTIVLNDAFWNLQVHSNYFSVDLLFEHKRSTLRIPFAAIVSFIDPGVEFALQINWQNTSTNVSTDNVIFLEQFRKKPTPEPL